MTGGHGTNPALQSCSIGILGILGPKESRPPRDRGCCNRNTELKEDEHHKKRMLYAGFAGVDAVGRGFKF
jgi:hypothetical protein